MLKKICNILSCIVIVILIAIGGLLIVPKFIGYNTFAVISGSMEPNIPVGSLVYVEEAKFEDIAENDVITFKLSSSEIVTHRVTKVNHQNQSLTTKGDANETDDGEPIAYKNVVGKVKYTIPYLGYLSLYIKTPLGIAVICGVVFIIILLNYLPDVFEKDEN